MAAVALYGLEVPPVGVLVPALAEDSIPNASYRITMAALDPTEAPEADEEGNIPDKPRATLKLVRQRYPDLDEELDDEYLEALMGGSDDEDSEDEAGPSDPSKSKKAKAEAALKKLIAAAKEDEDSDDEMADAPNGKKGKKGKQLASSDDDDDDESVDSDSIDLEEFVICTLDTEHNFQQPIDITIGPDEKVFFRVIGTHSIHLTGNYIVEGDEEDSEEDDDEYDDFPNELEDMYGEGSDSEDELDGLEDPRVTEVDSEEEAAPKLVKAKDSKKGKKRAAEEDAESLDALIAKADAADDKTSKKQQKKLKNNKGDAVEVEKSKAEAKESPKDAKKVQFAKNLEQGPTGSAANAEKGAAPSVKVIQGVTVDDRKVGKGRPAKSGNKVGVRYIGKLQDGKVFDSNKKGKPFTFAIGKGEVIKGWEIGLEGMQVGGERRITIPPKLAYGSRSQPGIPGNSTLVFDIKLLEIK
ncbi:hypothetical protein BKA67DRAFT_546636 [Truncatella angustata]|uniref:FK506-binding protein n=1 Tax=Truncatella angustata TaxID=152316 RepID=A0A9P8UX70_9PEZI|nr:uncharacterized protein BKA67DRAFT_546636 [Truncatella angustata]KAH6660043.1 hypothetical protein BKA67DRAFT_546636 [Truncatella angustata]